MMIGTVRLTRSFMLGAALAAGAAPALAGRPLVVDDANTND
jgi:hypothetical protein